MCVLCVPLCLTTVDSMRFNSIVFRRTVFEVHKDFKSVTALLILNMSDSDNQAAEEKQNIQ